MLSRVKSTLPAGTISVGAGLLVAGITAYAFLVVSARALGPERYAELSVLWTLVVLVGPGFFLPIEQELARSLSTDVTTGPELESGGTSFRRAAAIGSLLTGILVVATFVSQRWLLAELFDGERLLFWGFVIALVGYLCAHLLKGLLAGTSHFAAYGFLVAIEGILRLLGAIVLVVVGTDVGGPYGLMIGLAPIGAVLLSLSTQWRNLQPGPRGLWRDTWAALGLLLAGSALAQLLLNSGPIAVKLLATEQQDAAAGRFLAGLVMARIPLFLFQAVQAALLPKLAGLVGVSRLDDFRHGLVRLVQAILVLIAIVIGISLTIGPWLLTLLFGAGFELDRIDLAFLAAASGGFMVAIAFGQALIALREYVELMVGWGAGIAALVMFTAIGSDLLRRVETGFLAGTAVAALLMSYFTFARVKERSAAMAGSAGT